MIGCYTKHVKRDPHVLDDLEQLEEGNWLTVENEKFFLRCILRRSFAFRIMVLANIDTVSWFKVYLYYIIIVLKVLRVNYMCYSMMQEYLSINNAS